MLEGLMCFAFAALAFSLAGTAILGIACFATNRLFEVGQIENEETTSVETPQSEIEKNESFDSSNPYSVASSGSTSTISRRIYPVVPSKLALFLIELVSFAAFVALAWLGTAAVQSTLMHGNWSRYMNYTPTIVLCACWLGTCGLKGALLSRYFDGTSWKIVTTIVIDQAIWVVSVILLYVVVIVAVIAFGWIAGGFDFLE